LRDVEIPATRPLCGSVTLSHRRPLTELRLRETGRESKCMHPLRNDFGSIAVIAATLLQSVSDVRQAFVRPPRRRRTLKRDGHGVHFFLDQDMRIGVLNSAVVKSDAAEVFLRYRKCKEQERLMRDHHMQPSGLTRRRVLGGIGVASLALMSSPASAQETVDLHVPGGPSTRMITTSYPQKGPNDPAALEPAMA
jgi:hypothetical protein